MNHWKIGALLLFATLPTVYASPIGPWIVLNPTSSVTGAPGDDVGWGFTIRGDETYWVSITDVQLNNETSPVGTFFQYINGGPVDFAIEPATEWPDFFSTTLLSGLGVYHIDAGTPEGSHDSGEFIVHYDLYTLSPLDPDTVQVNVSPQTLYLPDTLFLPSFEIDVQSVPEPDSAVMVGVGVILAVIGAIRRRRPISMPRP